MRLNVVRPEDYSIYHTGSKAVVSFMENIAIRLEEKNGIARINEPVGLGIPLPLALNLRLNKLPMAL